MGLIAKGILRGCQGLFTPVSLGYPLSVFNTNSSLILGILLSEFHSLCSFLWVVEWIHESSPFSFFKPRKEKPTKRPGAVI